MIEEEECGCLRCHDKRMDELEAAGTLTPGQLLNANSRFIMCDICGNKRCPHATHHLLPCTGSNDTNQPGSVYQIPQHNHMTRDIKAPGVCPACDAVR